MQPSPFELVAPAGTPATLKAAVRAGADTVYCGLRDETNARNFPGLNFSEAELGDAVEFAHAFGARVIVAINTFAAAGHTGPWKNAVRCAREAGADAIVAADIGVLDHAAERYPDLRLHLSVQAAAGTAEAVEFYARRFGVKRVVLPRILSIPEIGTLAAEVNVEIEAFAFGGLCVMTEGRCHLSSFVTGRSPNLSGVCSPAEAVSYTRDAEYKSARLSGLTIQCETHSKPIGYPTLCKGKFSAGGKTAHLFEDPVSLNTLDVLPELADAGVTALKIEGRQRGKAYVERVTREFRNAIDQLQTGDGNRLSQAAALDDMTEGHRSTTGAYRKTWR
ncbi:ubiquinone anaerobic biosynthesis protein UbiU [Maricaulis sp.]|uniref:ubiquinone anaerobic biosynthesis protein UbiU n=1 Tax=Maricaulis sp. TaxID=1486257 RepID=UPI002B26796A|nr:peptidase U32 family protein [Maricaulis sp.]